MGQKTNPTLVRLERTNTHYKFCGYSHRFYPEQLHYNYKIHNYISKTVNKIKKTGHVLYIKTGHRDHQLYCIFPKKKAKRTRTYQKHRPILSRGNRLQIQKANISQPALILGLHTYGHNLIGKLGDNNTARLLPGHREIDREGVTQSRVSPLLLACFYAGCNTSKKTELMGNTKQKHKPRLEQTLQKHCINLSNVPKPMDIHHSIIQGSHYNAHTLSSYKGYNFYDMVSNSFVFKNTIINFIKCRYLQQSGLFIAQKISNAIKNRMAYPRLRKQILWDCNKSQWIKGIRVSLAGRVESRSKKAQKARTRTFQWGQTELHVFSSLVQFTKQDCVTPFGKIGIKVWICYG